MEPLTLLLFLVGLVLLIVGAEVLVRGASRLAATLGVSPLVIGLTVVAYGTSSPELAVSVGASWTGRAELAMGNVVGSNVFNVLFILGTAALIAPLVVAQQLVRREVPLMIGVSVLLLLLGLDGRISRWDGALLATGAVAFTAYGIWQSRRETAQVRAEYTQEYSKSTNSTLLQIGLIGAGLAALVLGSHWLVEGAVDIARTLGLSELIIGLTIVAAGTSLPEVATSVLASICGERDIAVGNVVGSNLFNVLAVLGLSAVVSPAGLPVPVGVLRFDLIVMIAVAIACLPIFFTGYRIARWEGALFLAYYVAYVTYLILAAQQHAALATFSAVTLWFAMPLTAVTLVVLAIRFYQSAKVDKP